MKDLVIKLVLVSVCIVLTSYLFQQCSKNKDLKKQVETCNAEYAELLKAKQKVDTVYKEGKTQYVYKTEFKTITDTLFVEGGIAYTLFEDTLKRPDLNLKARIVANHLRSIDYEYSVRERIIVRENIIYKHDTAIIRVRQPHLYMINEFGIPAIYAFGLHFQTKDRFGATAKINLIENKKFFSLGLVYRLL